jgi:hypothetical protein
MKYFRLRRSLLAALAGSALLTALVSAGSVSAAGMDLVLDTSPPEITSVKPLDGTLAAPNTNIGIGFSEAMDKVATENAFKMARVGGARVTGTYTWIGTSLVFDPTDDLVPSAKYVAVVGTGATDESGNPLVSGRTWEFKIAAPAPSTTGPVTTTVPPRAAKILTGTLRSGDIAGLGIDDNVFFEVDAAKTWGGPSTTSRIVRADWYAVLPAQHNLKSLKVTYRGSASAKSSQVVSIYNWRAGLWEKLDRRTVDPNEVTVEASPVGSPGDYVSGSSTAPDVLVRVQCERYDGLGFTSRGDLLNVTFEL